MGEQYKMRPDRVQRFLSIHSLPDLAAECSV